MSDKFQITKEDTGTRWLLVYPRGFNERAAGQECPTFQSAVNAFIEACDQWCPMCGRGAVVDLDRSYWKCADCGQHGITVRYWEPQ